ncbi:MAG: hypothetical protein ACQEXJ_00280 [Myxococcota bacterium]
MQRFLLVSAFLAVATLGACADDPLYTDCPLSNSIEAACAEEGETTNFTCVVEQHPYCNESICASWEGSSAFCTRACQADTECPTGSACRETDGQEGTIKFCVPDTVAEPGQS